MDEINSIVIEQTAKTPHIELNHLNGEIILSGKSIPENAAIFYEPVLKWVNKYILLPRPITNIRINLEYFNTSSSIYISKLLKTLTQIDNPNCLLLVHLYVPLEEFDDLVEIDDIKDAFGPITNIFQNMTPGVGLKLYATNDKSEVVKDTLVLM
jgi:hypothetical protein